MFGPGVFPHAFIIFADKVVSLGPGVSLGRFQQGKLNEREGLVKLKSSLRLPVA
jgi:hypothetical protein